MSTPFLGPINVKEENHFPIRWFNEELEDTKLLIKEVFCTALEGDLLTNISNTIIRCGYTADLQNNVFRYYRNFTIASNHEIRELIDKCITVSEILEHERMCGND